RSCASSSPHPLSATAAAIATKIARTRTATPRLVFRSSRYINFLFAWALSPHGINQPLSEIIRVRRANMDAEGIPVTLQDDRRLGDRRLGVAGEHRGMQVERAAGDQDVH